LLAVRPGERYRTLIAIREYPHTHTIYPFGEVLHYTDRRTELPAESLQAQLTDYLASRGLPALSATPIPATIEDSFMAYLGGAEEAPSS
jgi:hypothetical protein